MLNTSDVGIWTATYDDRAGGLSDKLERLAMQGADLNFLLARRLDRNRGKGVIFLAPLTGEHQIAAATERGFRPAVDVRVLRVEGVNELGLAYRMARVLAAEGINFRAFSGAVEQNQIVAYLALDSQADAARAARCLSGPI